MKDSLIQLLRKSLIIFISFAAMLFMISGSSPVFAEELCEEFYMEVMVPNQAGNYGDIYTPVGREVINSLRNIMLIRSENYESVEGRVRGSMSAMNIASNAINAAMEHSGNPKEGDYLFYSIEQFSYSAQKYDNDFHGEFRLWFRTTAAQEQAVDNAVSSLISSLNLNTKSTYGQIKSVYDWMTENIDYGYTSDADKSYSAYGALINKKAVCQGYSLLFYRMMLEMGIDCRIVVSESHAWNIVKIGEKYYHIDTTWGATSGNTSGYFLKGQNNFNISMHDLQPVYREKGFQSEYPISAADYSPSSADYGGAVAVKRVSLDQTWIDLSIGSTEQIIASENVVWKSTNPAVASVDSEGNITGNSFGVAYIVATNTASGKLARCTVNVVDTELPESFIRISGSDRFDTGVKAAFAFYDINGGPFDALVLASGLNYADALAGSYLAYVKHAPILITADSFGDTEDVYRYVNYYYPQLLNYGATIYILGGTSAVSEKAAVNYPELYNFVRLSGKDRYETNLKILEGAGVTDEDILVCTGNNYADSLSGSSAKKPIMLVSPDGLSEKQQEYLESLSEYDNKFYVIGGKAAVTEETEKQLAEFGETERLSGKTRFETSTLMAETFYENPDKVVLAYSHNFPDGLCGGPLAAEINAPIVLTSTGNETAAAAYCQSHGITSGYVLGGTGLISNYTVRLISGQ